MNVYFEIIIFVKKDSENFDIALSYVCAGS